MNKYVRAIGMSFLPLAAFLVVEASAQPEKPHPWCRSVSFYVPADDETSSMLVEEMIRQFRDRFDIVGTEVREIHSVADAIKAAQNNEVDFLVLPADEIAEKRSSRLMFGGVTPVPDGNRNEQARELRVIGSCCEIEGRSPVEPDAAYQVVVSPLIYEMGYKHMGDIQEAVDQAADIISETAK